MTSTHNLQPLLPHSMLWGHLLLAGEMTLKYPGLNGQCTPYLIAVDYPEYAQHGAVYLDLWPISRQMLTVFHPDMMAQFCQEPSLPKHGLLHDEFGPYTQGDDLVGQEGQVWKTWRSIFNPGFSNRNVLSTATFCHWCRRCLKM